MHIEVGKEYVAGFIVAEVCVSFVFVKIVSISEKYTYGIYSDQYGTHTLKFSTKTGREWRPQHWHYYRQLTDMEVHRHEHTTRNNNRSKSIYSMANKRTRNIHNKSNKRVLK